MEPADVAMSEKTLAEMKAGAEQVAANEGKPLDPNWLANILKVQERMTALRFWERTGKVVIIKAGRTTEETGTTTHRIVRVGEFEFSDVDAERNGSWPSELLIAQVALAVDAGVWDQGSTSPYSSK